MNADMLGVYLLPSNAFAIHSFFFSFAFQLLGIPQIFSIWLDFDFAIVRSSVSLFVVNFDMFV